MLKALGSFFVHLIQFSEKYFIKFYKKLLTK